MRQFEIADATLNEDDPGLSAAIAVAYRDRIRPLCLCRQPGIAMYVAAIGEQHVIKRMPLSGSQHDPPATPMNRLSISRASDRSWAERSGSIPIAGWRRCDWSSA